MAFLKKILIHISIASLVVSIFGYSGLVIPTQITYAHHTPTHQSDDQANLEGVSKGTSVIVVNSPASSIIEVSKAKTIKTDCAISLVSPLSLLQGNLNINLNSPVSCFSMKLGNIVNLPSLSFQSSQPVLPKIHISDLASTAPVFSIINYFPAPQGINLIAPAILRFKILVFISLFLLAGITLFNSKRRKEDVLLSKLQVSRC